MSTSTALSPDWIGIMRHAKSWYPGMDPEDCSSTYPALTDSGVKDTQGVARRLAELLDDSPYSGDCITLYHGDTPQSHQTVEVLRAALPTPRGNAGSRRWDVHSSAQPRFGPARLPTYGADINAINAAWMAVKPGLQYPCVIVGHDPQTTWLLHTIAPKAKGVSLATGELMILEPALQPPDPKLSVPERATQPPIPLEPRSYGRPRFVLSPSDPTAADALRAKIESKMRTAGILGAFLTALFTFAAKDIVGQPDAPDSAVWLGIIGLLLLAIAIVMYFITLFSYDGLLMPSRFWVTRAPQAPVRPVDHDKIRKFRKFLKNLKFLKIPEIRNWVGKKLNPAPDYVLRPPGSDVWVLYLGMLQIWNRAFVPATICAGLGVALLAAARVGPTTWWHGVLVALALVVVVASGVLIQARARVPLGVND